MIRVALWITAAGFAVASGVLVVTAKAPGAECGEGFYAVGHRCCAAVSGDGETCGPSRSCPAPLALLAAPERGQCIAPSEVVRVPETHVTIGPSDWEADGIVSTRELHVAPFALDAFEITEGRIHPGRADVDPARAAGGLTRAEVATFCAGQGGRLPTEEEWVAAAATAKASRYPWGDTGAVCRRAAWGLARGPCGHGARGPDTVGAHVTGDGPLGIHDLAGNVAEWVSGERGVVLGGSYETELASELRVWSRKIVDLETRDAAVGGRCAYDIR